MFSKFENLKNSDFMILNTFFNNEENSNEINIDKILFKVTNKLIDIADQAIEESKMVDNDSNIE